MDWILSRLCQLLLLDPSFALKLPSSVYGSLPSLFGDIDKNPFGFSRLYMVHVDDVARAHIFLLEPSNPKGRYSCSSIVASIDEIIDMISSKFPEIQIPKSKVLMGAKGPKLPHFTSKKLLDAGFEFKYNFGEMIKDVIECCKEKGYL